MISCCNNTVHWSLVRFVDLKPFSVKFAVLNSCKSCNLKLFIILIYDLSSKGNKLNWG